MFCVIFAGLPAPFISVVMVGKMTHQPATECLQLTKRFGSFTAVDNLDLVVEKGQICGFLGPNGAGKTTTIRMMTGLIHPTAGTVRICGFDIQKNFYNAIEKIGVMLESPGFYPYLSAHQNLRILAEYSGLLDNKRRIYEVLEVVGLSDRAKGRVITYSRGMLQRLGIAQALLSDPEILILDEPTNGLDPMGMFEIKSLIMQLSMNHNKTVLLSSHLLKEMESICSRVVIINRGRIIGKGRMKDLIKDYPNGLEDYFFQLIKKGGK